VSHSVDGAVVRHFDRSLASGLFPEILVFRGAQQDSGLSLEGFFGYCVFDANTTAVYAEPLRSLNGSHPSTWLKLGLRVFAMPAREGHGGWWPHPYRWPHLDDCLVLGSLDAVS